MGWKLKELGARSLGAAVALAKHYRDLNQPEEAESICRDILRVNPDEADALRTLGLALTDRFPTSWMTLFDEACSVFAKLGSEYERVYYTAVAWERYAKAQLEGGRAQNAIHAFEEAMQGFEEAERLGMRLNTFLQNFTRARKLLADCLERQGVALATEWR